MDLGILPELTPELMGPSEGCGELRFAPTGFMAQGPPGCVGKCETPPTSASVGQFNRWLLKPLFIPIDLLHPPFSSHTRGTSLLFQPSPCALLVHLLPANLQWYLSSWASVTFKRRAGV